MCYNEYMNNHKNIEELFTFLQEEGDVWPGEMVSKLSKEQLELLVWRFTAEVHGYEDLEFKDEVGLLQEL